MSEKQLVTKILESSTEQLNEMNLIAVVGFKDKVPGIWNCVCASYHHSITFCPKCGRKRPDK